MAEASIGPRGDNSIKDKVSAATGKMEQLKDRVIDSVGSPEEVENRFRDFVGTRPVATFFGAIAVGFIVGKLSNRFGRGF